MSDLDQINLRIESIIESPRLLEAKKISEELLEPYTIADYDELYDHNTVGLKVKSEFATKPEWDENLANMFPESYARWFNLYEREESLGGCGEWGVYMALKACGVENVTQSMVKAFGYAQGYGTANSVNYSFLRLFLKAGNGVREQEDTPFSDIEDALKSNQIIIANWYEGEGHYSIIGGITADKKQLLIVDGYPGRTGLYPVDTKTFIKLFFDTKDHEGEEFLERYCIIADPKYIKADIKLKSTNEIFDENVNSVMSTF